MAESPNSKKPANVDLQRTLNRALGGGVAGAAVCTLMPMRTVLNYQYRFGGTAKSAFQHMYTEGGIRRFYRGILPALFQGPLSRFGDTAANVGLLALLESNESTAKLPIAVKTLGASAASASFRILLTPIDTLKTTMQTSGRDGISILAKRVATNGPFTLWYGSLAAAGATFMGHYPWFYTYNYLQETLPKFGPDLPHKLARNAAIGFVASVVSDCVSNSARVVKTYRQTHPNRVRYPTAIREVIREGGGGAKGAVSLFTRGLRTRIAANAVQGVMFSVLWKVFQDLYFKEK